MNVKSDRVAILMATYNGAQWLEDQLRSLMQQTHSDWLLFPQDDGSTDSTVDLLDKYARLDNRIQPVAVAEERLGSATANFINLLLSEKWSSCSYVAFCDQDDIWAPSKLAISIDRLKSSGAEGYSCDLVAFDNRRGSAWYLEKGGAEVRLDYLFQGASAGCTYLLTADAVSRLCQRITQRRTDKIGDLSHDWLIYAICRSMGLKWCRDGEAHVFYRQHAQNAFGAKRNWQEIKRKLGLLRRGWYRNLIEENGRYLNGDTQEREVLDRISRLTLVDRWWLGRRAHLFRRRRYEALLLRLLLLIGLM